MQNDQKAFLIGAGIGTLAAAAFMIRDAGMRGQQITLFEAAPVPGGSLDGGGTPQTGYTLRGGRMLTTDNYECMWDLFKSIPSLDDPTISVYDDTLAFNQLHKPHSRARVVDRNHFRIDLTSMGFSHTDRVELFRISETSEAVLGASRITDWLSPAFFQTRFWIMWATTFAFQPWHSAVEFKRYLHRFIKEFSRIDTLAGIKRTRYNQYDSLVRPLVRWLQAQGVTLVLDCRVCAIDTRTDADRLTVTALHTEHAGQANRIAVAATDLVFLQNASMTDAATYGSLTQAPPHHSKVDSHGWDLWEKLAENRPDFGKPAVFNSCIAESYWSSFTVTLPQSDFFKAMEKFTGNEAGTGGLVTFQDANWLMSVVLATQPHFAEQPDGVTVFWGYALHPDRIGNFVAKPMSGCSGAEILHELCGHLNFDLALLAGANCIPCRMPYITSMFQPRTKQDRPMPVPASSVNLAMVSQFVEIADDVVFTVEYSVRAAQMAVYQLLHVAREVPPVTRHDQSLAVLWDAVVTAFH